MTEMKLNWLQHLLKNETSVIKVSKVISENLEENIRNIFMIVKRGNEI